jgi:hypothetical protein
MKIRTFAELCTANEQTLRFTPLGLATGGKLSPEAAAEFQQRSIASADLVDVVPDSTRQSFERLRTLHSYGVLCYDAFTVAGDLSWVVLEQALRERFIALYAGGIPLVANDGSEDTFTTTDFSAIGDAFRRGGSHSRRWKLKLRSALDPIPMPTTLRPLLAWARRERLLEGQRNRRVEAELFHRMRNRFAHGSDYRLGMPPDSARMICDLAEIINRLWGESTIGGRLYPAPLPREIVVVAWSPGWGEGTLGSSIAIMRPEQLADFVEDAGDWTCIVLRAVPEDDLTNFDARYERTAYPADLLWGPGSRLEAMEWAKRDEPLPDTTTHLDRLLAIRRDQGKVFLPCRPEMFLNLPADGRGGAWDVVRADFPNDALAHVRHGDSVLCREDSFGGCPVEDITHGSWEETSATVRSLCPGIRHATFSDVHVPGHGSLPDDIGH